MGVPPKKISNFFPEIFCQRIDRKSQEVSAAYVKPVGHDRHLKKVRVKLIRLTLPFNPVLHCLAAFCYILKNK